MKKILLFGAGKSATSLITYLIHQTASHGWNLVVADSNPELARSKLGRAPHAEAVTVRVEEPEERQRLVATADIVISLLPPSLHRLIAESCIHCGKDLLTASYLDEGMKAIAGEISKKGLLFICELGLDPGIDHMSALQMIRRVRADHEGPILSFHSHTGGLVAPQSDDNLWHYKISWNPRNVVTAGSGGARYKEDGKIVTRAYRDLFCQIHTTSIPGLGKLAWYPNRDSLAYIPLYDLGEAASFIRTTLRYPSFCKGWDPLVKAGLTDDKQVLPEGLQTFPEWSAPVRSYVDDDNRALLGSLGLFDPAPLPPNVRTSADVLQYLLETRLAMQQGDKDMIVMQHELRYQVNGSTRTGISTLVVEGEDNLQTAMAKTVGWPLGIAAMLILEGRLKIKGLHIPVSPEIYVPILEELDRMGIRFTDQVL